ncbi:TIGR02302 family protein [Tropicibacter sp. Alg240-R139]|uniref:TIGR02302 family protein n=1 Tax=Tropicibacter sp. Alg240-R139 TaxID=2305991 RepID=UPI00279539CF|nr:TIGR02302 family protein [Tropicibacter sp. Alg240-R139]
MTAKSPVHLPIPRLSLLATHVGMIAELMLRAFWPFFSIVMTALAALLLGLHDMVPVEGVWTAASVALIGALIALIWGARRFNWPSRHDALARLDESLPGRPIQALTDAQTIGASDPASVALWRAHQKRMSERAAQAKSVQPNLRLADRDPFALRYAALLLVTVGALFGSIWHVKSVAELTPGGGALANGPSWEGWVEPPRYTGLPSLYLNDLDQETLQVPEGSRITLRFYGEVGALDLAETVTGTPVEDETKATSHDLIVAQSGSVQIDGPGGKAWVVKMVRDEAPQISVAGVIEAEAGGQMSLPFTASDDYGVTAGTARIELDLAGADRRHGLIRDPEPREALVVDLPMPIAGDRRIFTEDFIEDFSSHPWANLPVTITLSAEDAKGNTGEAMPYGASLPGRRFFDPLAAAIIEQRRDILWTRDNAKRVSQLLRAISHRPEDVFRSETVYLRLRFTLRRLETFTEFGLRLEQRDEIAQSLWDVAVMIEDGTLGDALERLRQARERLAEAMKNGASDQEIAELMQELREATEDYLQQLQRQAQNDGQQSPEGQQQSENQMTLNQDDLQRMMDRIQELMEQGRMAEAEQALREFQEMMENMQMAQGQQGQGQSEGQQAMEGLAETLRNQQGLSDQAFRDLQEQFNQGGQSGQSQQNEGRNGGQGRGQSHEGQQGQGQGSGDREAQQGQSGGGDQGSLADRQQALRDELRRQQDGLPGAGTPEGDAARESLGRAGEAMENAEEALRQNDMAEAIDKQSEAMEALREGMRSLGEAMAQENQSQPGQGSEEGDMRAQNRDPLGRQQGSTGSISTDENLLQGEDVYRRARELLDEIRRRAGEGERPEAELEYLKRLLERF